jgi:hypothetical protein
VSDLESILDGRRTRGPVDLVFLTDHMSSLRHVVDDATVAFAQRCRRFAIGAEVQTCLPDDGGGWLVAPEVLLYGPTDLHQVAGGGYYGVTQALVDEAYDTCTLPGAPAPDTLRLHAFCRRRRIACALAHPLDGHALPFSKLLGVIGAFDFVETTNGGFSEANAQLLARLLEVLRQERRRRSEATGADSHKAPAHLALGGSDAHLNHFDRVVTLFSHDGDRPDAGTFIAAMLRAAEDPDGALLTFRPSGRGVRAIRLSWEVLTLIVLNLLRNRHHLANWRQVATVLRRGMFIAGGELRSKYRIAGENRRNLSMWLEDPRCREVVATRCSSVDSD